MAARSHDHAEPSGRELRQCRGGLRQQRGVSRIRIDHAGAEPDRARALRRSAQAGKHLPRPLLVVMKEVMEAESLGELDLVEETRARFGAERCERKLHGFAAASLSISSKIWAAAWKAPKAAGTPQ